MGSTVRSHLIAGFAVVAVSVVAIAPSVAAPIPTPTATQVHHTDLRTTSRIELAASVRSLILNPPNPAHVAAAKAAIERIDPAAAAAASKRQAAIAVGVPAAVPVALNTASDNIDAAYQFIQSWVNYGVQLATYVLQFVPYGYLISAQLNIFYDNLIQPIANSVVYDLIDPVVNDPLNPAVWVNGLSSVGQTSVNAAIATGVAEFNYFFGWLIPPLPPLPPQTLAAAAKTLPTAEVAAPSAAVPESTSAAPTAPTAPLKDQPEPTVVDADLPATPVADASTKTADATTSTAPSATSEMTTPGTAGTPSTQPSADASEGVDTSGTDKGGPDKKVPATSDGDGKGAATSGADVKKDDHVKDAQPKAAVTRDTPEHGAGGTHSEPKGPEKSSADSSSDQKTSGAKN